MSTSDKRAKEMATSDRLHNANCFNYLRNLHIPSILLKKFPPSLAKELQEILNQSKEHYNPKVPYADLYTQFFDYIEDNIITLQTEIDKELLLIEAQIDHQKSIEAAVPESQRAFMSTFRKSLESKKQELKGMLDDFIVSIYANDNHILESTYESIKHITLAQTPISKDIEKLIKSHIKNKEKSINTQSQSPAQAGNAYGRFTAMMSANFKPQHTTSLSTVRHYKANQGSPVTEYRFGTQGQRHEGVARVSPLFERFIDAQQRKLPTKKITHIYFNNLGRDRSNFEGKKEKALTKELEDLETRHPNIAVITLPADKGLMHQNHYKGIIPKHDYVSVKNEFLQIASQDPAAARKFKDFYISQNIRERLFKGKDDKYSCDAEKMKLNELLDNSFQAMGIKPGSSLSDSQQQAVWFHFIKFELTNHIINTLNPDSINFSCKDAIDRGGVSSAYYNLVKSFNSDSPMNREEFEQGLHAAPTMVKGRGMNHHLKLIWNTVDAYVNKDYDALKANPDKAWIIEWRDLNCPHARVEQLLKQRVTQLQEDLRLAKSDPINIDKIVAIDRGSEILTKIQEQTNIGVSGKRLLLEAAVRTSTIALNPSQENIKQYDKLADKLSINYPGLKVIGGLIKALAGIVLFVITASIAKSQATELINSGWSTAKADFNVDKRRDLQAQMKEQLKNIRAIDAPKADTPEAGVSLPQVGLKTP